MKKNAPLPRRIPAPWWMRALGLLAGPVLLVFTIGQLVWIHQVVSEPASAEIVEVLEHRSSSSGGSRTNYCPVFEWETPSGLARAESAYCGSAGDFQVGQQIDIRYNPRNPESVGPDTLWARYGFAMVVLPFSFVLTLPWLSKGVDRRRAKSPLELPGAQDGPP